MQENRNNKWGEIVKNQKKRRRKKKKIIIQRHLSRIF